MCVWCGGGGGVCVGGRVGWWGGRVWVCVRLRVYLCVGCDVHVCVCVCVRERERVCVCGGGGGQVCACTYMSG